MGSVIDISGMAYMSKGFAGLDPKTAHLPHMGLLLKLVRFLVQRSYRSGPSSKDHHIKLCWCVDTVSFLLTSIPFQISPRW